jgi:hypothetical protein
MFLGLVTGCLIGAPLIAQPQQTSGRPSGLTIPPSVMARADQVIE